MSIFLPVHPRLAWQAGSDKLAPVEVLREPPDSELAAALLASYFDELAKRFPGGFKASSGHTTSDHELVPPKGAFLVARLAGKPVGCGALRLLDMATGEVKHMWVDPEARGHGVGRALLSSLEEVARSLGCSVVRLDTSSHLPEAVALYRSAGYSEIGAYNDNPYAHHWFEKGLE
jgi:GNAT superfamily N-acetyltransferase